MSMPWILTEHMLDSKEPNMVEYVNCTLLFLYGFICVMIFIDLERDNFYFFFQVSGVPIWPIQWQCFLCIATVQKTVSLRRDWSRGNEIVRWTQIQLSSNTLTFEIFLRITLYITFLRVSLKVNLCFDQLTFKLSECIFAYYKKAAGM